MIKSYKMTALEDGNLQITLELKDKTNHGRVELMNTLSEIIDEFYEDDPLNYKTLNEIRAMWKLHKQNFEDIAKESIEENSEILDRLGSDYDENGIPYWEKNNG